jgi:hypothetical protein
MNRRETLMNIGDFAAQADDFCHGSYVLVPSRQICITISSKYTCSRQSFPGNARILPASRKAGVGAPAYETDNFRHAFYVLALRGLFAWRERPHCACKSGMTPPMPHSGNESDGGFFIFLFLSIIGVSDKPSALSYAALIH